MKSESESKGSIPEYAKGSFDRELNYKLWSTSKARFNAAERLARKHSLSTRAVAMLSAYVAVFSVITTILGDQLGNSVVDILVVIGVALSIIILVFSLLESAENYSVRADRYHQSGLVVSELYKELRLVKSRYEEKGEAFFDAVGKIREKYDDILQRSENHETIDHLVFKASKPDYDDHMLSDREVDDIHRKVYLKNYFMYHCAMVLPPVVFAVAIFVIL